MKNWQKILLVFLILGTAAFIKFAFFTPSEPVIQSEEPKPEQEAAKEEENPNVPKSYVKIYFLGQNENKEEVYKVVKREYNPAEGTKFKVAIKDLIQGPNPKEKSQGIYSEIPQGTKLLSLDEKPGKIIINVNSDYEQGGGTDGLYKRLYQLIKTSNKNTATDVYLYINGKQAEVVGGEGIMINQPLNEKSLEE